MAREYSIDSFLLCEDVRREDNGKEILIGVYNDAIIFNKPLPGILGKLCVRIKFLPHFRGEKAVTYEVLTPSKKSLFTASGNLSIDSPNEISAMALPIVPAVFSELGTHVIKVGIGEKPRRIGTFEVRVRSA